MVLDAFTTDEDDWRGLGSEIVALFSSIGLDSEIPELRGLSVETPLLNE